MKVTSIAATQLDLVQSLPVSQAVRRHHQETLIYPGRHNDFHSWRGYFEYLGVPQPDISLDIRLNDCETSTALLLSRLERAISEHMPDLLIVRGDTSLALAAAVASTRLQIPLVRIDGGRRAYSKHAAVEVNRLVADRLADVVFCSSEMAQQRLMNEGIAAGVYVSGDVLLDVVQRFLPVATEYSSVLSRIGLHPGVYVLAMLARPETIDNPTQLRGIISAFNAIREPIVLSSQARTRLAIDQLGLRLAPHILPIDSVGYLDHLMLVSHARAIITDLDEVQREAYFLSIPCITACDTTESPETVEVGWNRLVDAQPDQIIATVRDFIPPINHPPIFGDGQAGESIAEVIDSTPITFGQNYGPVPVPVLVA